MMGTHRGVLGAVLTDDAKTITPITSEMWGVIKLIIYYTLTVDPFWASDH